MKDLRERQVKERSVTRARVRREPWRVQIEVEESWVCEGFTAENIGGGAAVAGGVFFSRVVLI